MNHRSSKAVLDTNVLTAVFVARGVCSERTPIVAQHLQPGLNAFGRYLPQRFYYLDSPRSIWISYSTVSTVIWRRQSIRLEHARKRWLNQHGSHARPVRNTFALGGN